MLCRVFQQDRKESKVTELVTEQMPAKFWVYFKAPGLSTMPEESSVFLLASFLELTALCTVRRYLNTTLFQRDAQVGSEKEEDQAGCTQTRKVVEVLGLLLLLL